MILQQIDIGSVIEILIVVVGFIVGYTKLNQKVKQNTKDILDMAEYCDTCKEKQKMTQKQLRTDINKRFQKIDDSIKEIKDDTRKIAQELAKLNGIMSTFLNKAK